MSDDLNALKAQIASLDETIRVNWLRMADLPMPSLERRDLSREIAGLNRQRASCVERQKRSAGG